MSHYPATIAASWTATDPKTAFAEKVPALPARRFERDEAEHDLRTAYTGQEIWEAELAIAKMATLKDIINQAGNDGVTLTCIDPSNLDLFLAGQLRQAHILQENVHNVEVLAQALVKYTNPPAPEDFCQLVAHQLAYARNALEFHTKDIEKHISHYQVAIRAANLRLRRMDIEYLSYGKIHIRDLTTAQRNIRRNNNCEWCHKPGHFKTDHTKFRCKICGKSAPNHNLKHCPERPVAPRHKKRKTNWTTNGWEGIDVDNDYDDYVCDEAEHNMAT